MFTVIPIWKEKLIFLSLIPNSSHTDSLGLWVCPPVNLKMSQQTIIHDNMDAVVKCSDWDADPLCIMESDKNMYFTLRRL